MRLSTKSRIATNVMLDLAMHQHVGPVALSSLAARHRVSLSYIEHMFRDLRRCVLVEGTRGRGGGFRLVHDSGTISVADIVLAVEDQAWKDATRAQSADAARADGVEATVDLWNGLSIHMLAYLQTITLGQLFEQQRGRRWMGGAGPCELPPLRPAGAAPTAGSGHVPGLPGPEKSAGP